MAAAEINFQIASTPSPRPSFQELQFQEFQWTRRATGALLATASLLLAACGGGESCEDKITLGTSQGCGRSTDAVTLDYPIFYVKRPAPASTAQPANVLRLRQFEPGGDLYMRTSASPSAGETNLTASFTNGNGDVRDVDVSYDGRKVVFAMRFPFRQNTQEVDQPASWDIYEYDLASGAIRGLVVDPLRADPDDPRFDDRFPHYLPDGRIVFTSSRQRTSQAILLDEGKSQYQAQDENNTEPASVLHVMDAGGGNLHQISFNQSHDLDSAVLPNGQIVFSRWDGAAGADHVDLYRMNPDGSNLELLYGKQPTSHATGNNAAGTNNTVIQFLSPKPLANGFILSLARPFTGTDESGDLISIDTNTYVENSQPTLPNAGMAGPAQQRVPQAMAIYTNPGLSPGGRFRSVFPLGDGSNRLLVSWTPCRVVDNGAVVPCSQRPGANLPAAPPLFGIWIFNPSNGTQLPIVTPTEGIVMSDVIAAAPRTAPPVILDRLGGVDYAVQLENESAGIIDIRSVYDIDGVDTAPGGIANVSNPGSVNFPTRPARFLRVEKAVSLPNNDVRNIRGTSFSPAGRFMREILGYAPIEPDGSVRVKVPANVAIQLSMVDRNARGISPLHRNWLQLRPGQVLTCNGCHNPNIPQPAQQTSHGRQNLFASVSPGAPASGLYPNSDSALIGIPGQSMAQTRARVMCPLGNASQNSSACSPSVNVIYNDFWTDPITAGRPKETSFDYCYSTGPTDVLSNAADTSLRHTCTSRLDTLPPTPVSCETNWTSNCRIVVNYVANVQPLWDKPRPAGAADNRCTSCHSPVDAANANRVPAGQLDLSATQSSDEPDHLTSYRKLLFTHNAQELNGTMLRDICVLPRDPVTGACPDNGGDNNPANDFVSVSAPMNALNARGSRFFFVMSGPGTTVNHASFMTEAEKRLISEWLDIGAQYYNDPFLAPEN